MPTTDIRLRYIADISKALSGMESVQGATRKQIAETNRATAALKSYDKAQAATAKTATGKVVPSLGAARAATQNLQAQIFDIGVGLQGGQNPFTILVQQGPQIAQAMTGAGGGVNALKAAVVSVAAILGPVVAIIGTFWAAWQIYTEEQDRANEVMHDNMVLQEDLQPILDDTRAKLIDLAEATGELTEAEARRWRESTAGLKRWQQATSETATRLKELRKEQASVSTQITDQALAWAAWVPYSQQATAIIDGLTTDSGELGEQIAGLQSNIDDSTQALRENVEVTQDVSEAKDEQARSTKRASDATRQLARDEREAAKEARDAQRATSKARAAMFADINREKRERAELAAFVRSENEQASKDAEQATRIAQQLAKEQAAFSMSLLSSAVGTASDIASVAAERGLISQKAADRATQASALYNIGVSTAAAVVKGMAIFGPPPSPPGIAAIIAATAIGAAQAGVVLAKPIPSYGDTPGPVRAGTEGMTANFAPGDLVVAARTREGLQNQTGGGGGPVTVNAEFRYKHHRNFNRVAADNLSMSSSPLSKAIRGTNPDLGHR